MANFVYLVVEEKSREALVVDSGWEITPLEEAVKNFGAKVKYTVATHEHFDHVSTLNELATKLSARVVGHRDSPVRCDVRVSDGEELSLGAKRVRVLYTPGHTEDSICLYDGVNVFTGDTLFVDAIGRFARAKAEEMYNSLHNVILGLPPSTMMYPGHDYGEVPSRTLGEEAAANPFLRPKDLRGFQALF